MFLHELDNELLETDPMIKQTTQSWTPGATVKVGFMTLIVKRAIPTPGDSAPDAYLLTNQAGTQIYKFVPHNGVTKISAIEAQALLADADELAARLTYRALKNAADAARVAAVFA